MIYQRTWNCAGCNGIVLYDSDEDSIWCLCGDSHPIQPINKNDRRSWIPMDSLPTIIAGEST